MKDGWGCDEASGVMVVAVGIGEVLGGFRAGWDVVGLGWGGRWGEVRVGVVGGIWLPGEWRWTGGGGRGRRRGG